MSADKFLELVAEPLQGVVSRIRAEKDDIYFSMLRRPDAPRFNTLHPACSYGGLLIELFMTLSKLLITSEHGRLNYSRNAKSMLTELL
jgi:hypothetical protein